MRALQKRAMYSFRSVNGLSTAEGGIAPVHCAEVLKGLVTAFLHILIRFIRNSFLLYGGRAITTVTDASTVTPLLPRYPFVSAPLRCGRCSELPRITYKCWNCRTSDSSPASMPIERVTMDHQRSSATARADNLQDTLEQLSLDPDPASFSSFRQPSPGAVFAPGLQFLLHPAV